MSSLQTIAPSSLHDLHGSTKDHMQPPLHHEYQRNRAYSGHITPTESNLLSPYSSNVRSNSASPTGNSNTPADSIATTEYSQFSEAFSSSDGDPFFGVDFDDVDGTGGLQSQGNFHPSVPQHGVSQYTSYPMSPTTASFDNNSSSIGGHVPFLIEDSSLQAKPSTDSMDSNRSAPQLTPDTNGGSWSSDEPIVSTRPKLTAQSPRVTVSMWKADGDAPIQGIERSFTTGAEESSSRTVRAPHSIAGDLACEPSLDSLLESRDARGVWFPNMNSGHRGLAPGERPSEEVPSINQQAARRERQEKNNEVAAWVTQSTNNTNENSSGSSNSNSRLANSQQGDDDNIPTGDIPLGDTTENRHIPRQTYFRLGDGGPINSDDFELMRQLRNWEDAPMIHAIQKGGKQYQPETSQAAIEKFNRQCQDNASIISAAATWGTRRRSLPSIVDTEGVISGNFLKKLSITSHARRPSFMKKVNSLMRKPSSSQILKRKGSNASEVSLERHDDQEERRESKDSLAPPPRTSSWGLGNKKPTPSLNTALVGMATGAAAIGTTHARSGSISATSMTSPKSPKAFSGLTVPPVKNTLRRPRSKTDLPRSSTAEASSHPNLVGMLRQQGGPPVAQLARSHPAAEADDDEDEDEEGYDDIDVKAEAGKIENIIPTLQGFKDHVLRLNPSLESSDDSGNLNNFLVERIAHQMIIRYKHLQNAKIKHIRQVNGGLCSCGALCIALGGSAMPLDSRGGDRGVDPMSTRPNSSDGDSTPLEPALNTENFPSGIPMPPTASLPAEFECQLCFTSKRFQKPSDWTKHVHEDVQPFTCTWPHCREPKMFKRKADWVRHENEGHRHLEWWTCDVEDCHHTCYRRDNFLQHLVREHKFIEPKVKTKAAIKKAGGGDRTWQKVEQCHKETQAKPSSEPCRFCNKTFPTWKKLTVHLAKHMEHISLPVLKLVAAKELDADTIISPVQDPPPRSFGPPPVIKQDPGLFSPDQRASSQPSPMDYGASHGSMGYPNMSQVPVHPSYYTAQQNQPYTNMSHQTGGMMMQHQYNPQPQYQPMPVTTTSTYPTYGLNMPVQDTEPFPAFDSLGIQDPTGAMAYSNMQNPALQTVDQYSNQGSVSPYSHSPHHGHSGTFYRS
ncbi:hypothetical protein F5Y15DRAFT_317158 [Xylariaceae sp. FL0016]|nr:hypothetical protein F5Y15DRAFT_317158 [Xylariaceae sp. FL0016]